MEWDNEAIISMIAGLVGGGGAIKILDWWTKHRSSTVKSNTSVKRSEFEFMIKSLQELQDENERLYNRMDRMQEENDALRERISNMQVQFQAMQEEYMDCKRGVMQLVAQVVKHGEMPVWLPDGVNVKDLCEGEGKSYL